MNQENVFTGTSPYSGYKWGNFFSKIDQIMEVLDAFEKQATSKGEIKCTITSLFQVFFSMTFDILKCYLAGSKRRPDFEKKKLTKKLKMSKTSPFRHF